MVLHFKEIFEGYITLLLAPLPRHYLAAIPMADQVQGAGLRADEVAKLPVSGAFKFESVTPGRRAPAGPQRRTTRACRRASRPTSTP